MILTSGCSNLGRGHILHSRFSRGIGRTSGEYTGRSPRRRHTRPLRLLQAGAAFRLIRPRRARSGIPCHRRQVLSKLLPPLPRGQPAQPDQQVQLLPGLGGPPPPATATHNYHFLTEPTHTEPHPDPQPLLHHHDDQILHQPPLLLHFPFHCRVLPGSKPPGYRSLRDFSNSAPDFVIAAAQSGWILGLVALSEAA